MQSIAISVVQQYLNVSDVSAHRLHQGDQNVVFRVDTSKGSFSVRMSRDENHTYAKEQWAMQRAAGIEVPVPKVHSVGEENGIHYIIMDWIHGETGVDHANKSALYYRLGTYAHRLSTIQLDGYGWNFATEPNPHFTQSWQQAVDQDEAYIFGQNTLLDLNLLTITELERVRRFMHDYRAWNLPSCLSHNDICLDNVIIANDGTIYLIDWSNVCGQPSPLFEIARVGSAISPELFSAFIKGYAISDDEWKNMSATVEQLKLVHALRALVWALRDAPAYVDDFAKTVRTLASTQP